MTMNRVDCHTRHIGWGLTYEQAREQMQPGEELVMEIPKMGETHDVSTLEDFDQALDRYRRYGGHDCVGSYRILACNGSAAERFRAERHAARQQHLAT